MSALELEFVVEEHNDAYFMGTEDDALRRGDCGDREEKAENGIETSLRPLFDNWADQVEYEEALLAEAGLRLTPTWEELMREVADDSATAYSAGVRRHYDADRYRREVDLARLACSPSFCKDELDAYLEMIRNSKYAYSRTRRALPPARGSGRSAPKVHASVKNETSKAESNKRGTKRKNRSRTASGISEPGHERNEEKLIRSANGAPIENQEEHASAGKKHKKRGKESKEKKAKKKASEVGRKLFVGGIIFADLEEDKEAQELRTEEEMALLAEIRREVFVEAVLGSFGDIERLNAEWEGRYCHVVYASRAAAERAYAALSDHQERRRLCEETAVALLRESGLPEAAAPLPNFYVRWPKDTPAQASHRACHQTARNPSPMERDSTSMARSSIDEALTVKEESRAEPVLADVYSKWSEHGSSECEAPSSSATSAHQALVSANPFRLLQSFHPPGKGREFPSPPAIVLCAFLTLYSYVFSCIITPQLH